MVGGRRLSELLREQQEPFLLLHGEPCCSSVQDRGARASWRRAMRRALPRWRWAGLAAGCFPCTARRKRESFRPLPRAGHACCNDDAVATESDGGDGARRLSPVSVLDVLRCSDEEEEASSSPTLSHSGEEEDNDEKPSWTPAGSSPPPPDPLTDEKEEWRKVVSSWERIAGDIARVPALAELDLSSSMSAREWEWHGESEAERVGASVEAIIFEEMSAEAVRDMVDRAIASRSAPSPS
ncbi:hypothetical protein CFC21_069528 [Triticum aestivum]|uniref:Uncharacterized protein n=3 Tax=Triticum TaxID=4564 RepID=A0A9R0WXV6_TRITD|nr:uncharacterized protein LOC123115424 [Triticum aestivum]KAF7062990.1 hypothetical protein CFC21_069528 [Triticum aestivum]VAI26431.1 unnamed protein product [Triticum turgidum subsp. durum]